MPFYDVEANIDGEWISIAEGEFDDFNAAVKALDNIDYDINDLRVKQIKELDDSTYLRCDICNGKVIARKGDFVCAICRRIQDV